MSVLTIASVTGPDGSQWTLCQDTDRLVDGRPLTVWTAQDADGRVTAVDQGAVLDILDRQGGTWLPALARDAAAHGCRIDPQGRIATSGATTADVVRRLTACAQALTATRLVRLPLPALATIRQALEEAAGNWKAVRNLDPTYGRVLTVLEQIDRQTKPGTRKEKP